MSIKSNVRALLNNGLATRSLASRTLKLPMLRTAFSRHGASFQCGKLWNDSHPLDRCVDNSARFKKLLPQCLTFHTSAYDFQLCKICAKGERPSSVDSTIRSLGDMITYPTVYYINYSHLFTSFPRVGLLLLGNCLL